MRVDSIIKFRKDDGLDIHATQGPVIWPDDGSNLLFGAKYEAKRCNLKYLCPNIHVANQLSQDLQHFDQLFED